MIVVLFLGAREGVSWAEDTASVPPQVQNAVNKQEAKTEEPKAEKMEDIKDPFVSFLPVPTAAPEAPAPQHAAVPEETFDCSKLQVAGIVWGELAPKAIIDGRILGKGDLVQGAEIVDISKEGILLRYKGKEYLMKRESYAPVSKKEQGGKDNEKGTVRKEEGRASGGGDPLSR